MKYLLMSAAIFISSMTWGAELKVGDKAPTFKLKTQAGQNFDLNERKGLWTVLYFYPKADTPGCTKQACAFRDNLSQVKELGAEVFGISVNTQEEQKKFHEKHKLNFTLLADADGKVGERYGAKTSEARMSRRWTFIIGPQLDVMDIDRDVDPVSNPERVVTRLKSLQKK